jgi:outer membrane protein assembly factor BamA
MRSFARVIWGVAALAGGCSLPALAAAASTPEDLVIESVQCTGNRRTDCELIRRELYLSEGDKIDEEEIDNARIRIALLGLFSRIDLSLKKGSERGKVQVQIDVEEASPYFTEATLGSAYAFYRPSQIGELRAGNRNLFGKGKVLQGAFRYERSLSRSFLEKVNPYVEYVDPGLFGSKKYYLNSSLSYYYTRDEWDQDTQLLQNSLAFSLTAGRRIFDFSYVAIG